MKANLRFLGYVREQFSTRRFAALGNSARGLQKSVWGGDFSASDHLSYLQHLLVTVR